MISRNIGGNLRADVNDSFFSYHSDVNAFRMRFMMREKNKKRHFFFEK